MSDGWAIHIDVEGFAAKWDDTMDAFCGLNALMQGIYWLGSKAYPDPPLRLFAYQFGDGFLITTDYREEKLDRAILICIALMRHVLDKGGIVKAAIAEGQISDIQGCYPPEIRSERDKSHIIFGSGVMTVFPVMGTALINSVAVAKKSPSGPLLTVEKKNRGRLQDGLSITSHPKEIIDINWIQGEPEGLVGLQKSAGFRVVSEKERMIKLSNYVSKNPTLTSEWERRARELTDKGI